MNIKELQERAQEIRHKYDGLNSKNGHGKWGGKEYAMGFVGDVGDLMKLIMAKENLRTADNVDAKLRHELGDCLWSLLAIAAHYDIDLEAAFNGTMAELDKRLTV